MEKKRSVGITIIAWFSIIGFILSLPIALNFNLLIGLYRNIYFAYFMILYTIIFNSLYVIAAVNLLKLKDWARRLMILWHIIGFPIRIINEFFMKKQLNNNSAMTVFFVSVTSVLVLIIIYYLTRPKVKEQFR